MKYALKRQFIDVVMRFKKIDLCPASAMRMQSSELAVMLGASSCCSPDDGCAGVSEIHQTLHISKAAVSQTLNNLEKKGYIVRKIDPADRRKITVTVTSCGEQELEKARVAYDETLDRVLAQLGEENARDLVRLIGRLLEIFEELEQGGPCK